VSSELDRREFIKRVLALSATGAVFGLSGCGRRAAPATPTASPVKPSATGIPATAIPATAIPAAAASSGSSPAVATETAPALAAATVPPPEAAYLAVARGAGADPAEITRRAIAAVGGIERFVKPGADVVVKPNICTAYHGPEYASTTNPTVVSTIISLCLGAGAKRVRVMDSPFGGTPQASYTKSGIEEAVKAAGGQMEVMNYLNYRKIPLPGGVAIKEWEVYADILDADVLINVPIAKHHGSARLTLAMKNLMGTVKDRQGMHARGLHQPIADVCAGVRPDLNVVDAIRILTANGPTGGNLNDVKQMDTIIASTDIVAADAYATTLFGKTAADIPYIGFGAKMGLGQMDLNAIKIEEIAV
jgi:uncharacterized protein (DUF362 family)